MAKEAERWWAPTRFRGLCCLLALQISFLAGQGGSPPAEPAPRLNRLIASLEEGRPVFGIWCSDFSLHNAAALSDSALDFIIIDMEHSQFDFQALRTFLQGMISRRQAHESLSPSVVPIVRLPQNGRERLQFLIKQALDAGAYGLMLPHINTVEEAVSAIQATRYPQAKGASDRNPPGWRGVAPDPAARYWGISVDEYVRRADIWPLDPEGEILLIAQIESLEGVLNVREILKVPGISSVFIGPADLSFSLGFPNQTNAPQVQEMISSVLKACLENDVPCGITSNSETVEAVVEEGYRVITVGEDGGISADTLAALKRVGMLLTRDENR